MFKDNFVVILLNAIMINLNNKNVDEISSQSRLKNMQAKKHIRLGF